MIARTETARASEAGLERSLLNANDAARTNDQPIPFIGERWVASPDCCEFCAEMDGKESGFGEAYYEIGDSMSVEGVGSMSFTYEDVEYPPLHPNCRCTMTPIIAEDYR
jgi:hypothetical protein